MRLDDKLINDFSDILDEKEMLENLMNLIRDEEDIFYTWNGNGFDFAVFQRLVEIDGFDAFKEIGFFDVTEHEVTCLDIELAAVRSVSLVAVIFCGVMTCSDDNACMAVQVPYGE